MRRRTPPGQAAGTFAISVVVHLVLLFWVFPDFNVRVEGPAPGFFRGLGARSPGTEVVTLLELPALPGDEPPAALPEPAPEAAPAPADPTTPGGGGGAGEAAPGPAGGGAPGGVEGPVGPSRPGISAAERLRPRIRDPRLWAPLPPEVTELSPEQRMRLALRQGIREVRDSMMAADEAARRALDWTYTDAEGRRWGISPGKLHLGDVTLPMPVFSAPYGSEAAVRESQWNDIERAAGAAAVRESLEERQRIIRERRDRERARERGDSTAPPPRPGGR